MGPRKEDIVELEVARFLDDVEKHGPNGFLPESVEDLESATNMDPQEIADLKDELREDPQLRFHVCAALALHRLNVYEASSPDKPIFDSRDEFAVEAMAQKDELTELLHQALALPDGEWPVFIINDDGDKVKARPDEFSETLEALRIPPENEGEYRG